MINRGIALFSFQIVLALTHATAAFERVPAGARELAMCGASLASSRDPFGLEANPADIPHPGGLMGGFSMTPGLFGMKELQRTEAALSLDLFGGSGGILVRTFGFKLYRETTAMAALSVPLTKEVVLGAGLTWYSLTISGYGHAGTLGVSVGTTILLADQLRYAFSLRNVNRPLLGRSREPIPTELLTGIEFEPLPSFLLAASLTRDPDSPLCGSFGVEWIVEGRVVIRCGAQEGLRQFGAGAGVILGAVSLDYGISIHPDLGLTHQFSLSLCCP